MFDAFEINNLYFKLDVWCDENGYNVHFWIPNDENYDINNVFKDKLDLFSEFTTHNNLRGNIKKHFALFEEDKLFDFIDKLLVELKKIKELE